MFFSQDPTACQQILAFLVRTRLKQNCGACLIFVRFFFLMESTFPKEDLFESELCSEICHVPLEVYCEAMWKERCSMCLLSPQAPAEVKMNLCAC